MLTGSGEAKGVACSERHRGNSAFDPSAEPVPGCHARFLRIPCLCSSRDRLKSHWVVASPIGQFCYRIPSQFVETVVRAQIDRGKRRGYRAYFAKNEILRIAHTPPAYETVRDHNVAGSSKRFDNLEVARVACEGSGMVLVPPAIASHRYSHPIGRRCSAHGSVPNSTWAGAGARDDTNALYRQPGYRSTAICVLT